MRLNRLDIRRKVSAKKERLEKTATIDIISVSWLMVGSVSNVAVKPRGAKAIVF